MAKEQTFEHPPRGHVALLVYDPTNDRFNVVQGDDVDTAIPAAGKALLAIALAHGYDGSAWRKLPLLWGYTSRYPGFAQNLNLDAGTNTLAIAAIDAGYVAQVLGASIQMNSATGSNLEINATLGGNTFPLLLQAAPAAWVPYIASTPILLAAGDYIWGSIQTATAGDDLWVRAWGYLMAIGM